MLSPSPPIPSFFFHFALSLYPRSIHPQFFSPKLFDVGRPYQFSMYLYVTTKPLIPTFLMIIYIYIFTYYYIRQRVNNIENCNWKCHTCDVMCPWMLDMSHMWSSVSCWKCILSELEVRYFIFLSKGCFKEICFETFAGEHGTFFTPQHELRKCLSASTNMFCITSWCSYRVLCTQPGSYQFTASSCMNLVWLNYFSSSFIFSSS